jgi:hypothetical protein
MLREPFRRHLQFERIIEAGPETVISEDHDAGGEPAPDPSERANQLTFPR